MLVTAAAVRGGGGSIVLSSTEYVYFAYGVGVVTHEQLGKIVHYKTMVL